MPRQARVTVPGFPHHIVQRGHNRQPVFVERRDFEYYLANLQEWKQVYKPDVFSNPLGLLFFWRDQPISKNMYQTRAIKQS
jgi:putative transposase